MSTITLLESGGNSSKQVKEINYLLLQLSKKITKLSFSEIRDKVENPYLLVAIATEKKKIVGTASLYLVDVLGGISSRIEDVVVDEQCRERGTAKDLLEFLISIARVKVGMKHIELTSDPERTAANKMYLSMGFKMIAKATKGGTNLFRLELGGSA